MTSRFRACLKIVSGFLFAASLAVSGPAFAASGSGANVAPQGVKTVLPASPRNYVVDLAGIMDAQSKTQTDLLLKELEQKTGAQVIVLTTPSLNGEDVSQFAFGAFRKWRLGQKGKDNGLVFVVAPNERKYFFSTGYGLEGLLPDSYLGTLGRQVLVPAFKAGQYPEGIEEAVAVIARRIARQKGVVLTGMPRMERRGQTSWFPFIVGGIFFLLLLISSRRGGGGLLPLLFLFGGFPSGGWGGGGGFSGGGFGGFGGFGGGGGGSFGGGGAGGSW